MVAASVAQTEHELVAMMAGTTVELMAHLLVALMARY
jgi:hypothetical protein